VRQCHDRVLEFELRVRALEVEALVHLAAGLVNGVGELVLVEFGNDVEGGHKSYRVASGFRVAVKCRWPVAVLQHSPSSWPRWLSLLQYSTAWRPSKSELEVLVVGIACERCLLPV
jgi:hypothetical protein